jgi:NAD dependent epimerase/dehydratase family
VNVAGLHVVIGAGGGTGSAVVRELAGRDLRVRAVTRSGKGDVPEGVEQVAADVGTPGGARQACEGAAVVYHCAQPPYTKWAELFRPMTDAILAGAAAVGAKLVFADNLYVYGPPDGPMTEDTPQRAQGKKGRVRIEMANALLRAHADGRLRVTIGRASDYYGPRGTTSTVGENIMKPLLRDKRVRLLGSLELPRGHGPLARDVGRARRGRRSGLAPAGRGTAPGPAVPRAAVRGGRARPEDRGRLETGDQDRGPVQPAPRELNETLYQFERPFVSDASKFQAAFGPFEPTPHRAAVSRTVDWFRRRYGA